MVTALDLRLRGHGFDSRPFLLQVATLGKFFAAHMPRSPCTVIMLYGLERYLYV